MSFLPFDRIAQFPGDAATFALGVDGAGISRDRFASIVEGVRVRAAQGEERRWILYAEDGHLFAAAACGVLLAGKDLLLPNCPAADLLSDIQRAGDGILSDLSIPGSVPIQRCLEGTEASGSHPKASLNMPRIVLYTSGSTGRAKEVVKGLDQVDAELRVLVRLWGPMLADRCVAATVSPQHYYGLLFYAFLPLCVPCTLRSQKIIYPETLEVLAQEGLALISSPAFLRRIGEGPTPRVFPRAIAFSSGGALPPAAAANIAPMFERPPIEVYGSTETGGIAWRFVSTGSRWNPFDGVALRLSEEGEIRVRSPYLREGEELATGDLGRIDAGGGFELLGRTDSIVKIEEKRVSLVQVAEKLRESSLVRDAYVLTAGGDSGRLGALVVLSAAGIAELGARGRAGLAMELRAGLARYFDPAAIPRKLRFVDVLPGNEQGKIPVEIARGLLAARPEYSVVMVAMEGERLLLTLHFDAGCTWFQGHFPSFPLLPAVAQIGIAIGEAARRLGMGDSVARMPRLKFTSPIRPGSLIELSLAGDSATGTLSFSYDDPDGGQNHSSGKILLVRR